MCLEGDGWRDEIRSVARIVVEGVWLCTATLLNNTAQDDTPYLLGADHCGLTVSNASSLVVYWNYESPQCGDHSGGSLNDNQTGAELIASSDETDFFLARLDQQPDAGSNVYYAGWDARDLVPDAGVGIHHPSGGEKSISFEYDPLSITSYLEYDSPGDGNFLRVSDWDAGTTEPGSTGSALFNAANGLVVGTLNGGYAACGNDESDWYGRFHRHWEGLGHPEDRLRDWLDPTASGALTLAGKNPGEIFIDRFESGDTSAWSGS